MLVPAYVGLSAFIVSVPLVAEADPLTVLVNYGGLIGAFVLVIIGRLHTTGEVTILKDQVALLSKQLEDERDITKSKDSLIEALTHAFSKNAIPAMADTSKVLEAIPSTETALASLLRESLAKTEELTARLGRENEVARGVERTGGGESG
jgi:hypothetical protein